VVEGPSPVIEDEHGGDAKVFLLVFAVVEEFCKRGGSSVAFPSRGLFFCFCVATASKVLREAATGESSRHPARPWRSRLPANSGGYDEPSPPGSRKEGEKLSCFSGGQMGQTDRKTWARKWVSALLHAQFFLRRSDTNVRRRSGSVALECFDRGLSADLNTSLGQPLLAA